MATDGDKPTRDESSDSGSDSGSDDDDTDSGAATQVEWLATTRAKRSTAGNRMRAMLANEEPAAEDDDLELLFAEDGEDAGFTDVEKDDSDVHMDSSSDDEDQDAAADEDAGEKELQRQAREKKLAQRKRKADAAIPVKFRKKVRIEHPPTSSQSPAPRPEPRPRPKKKSERASWLPTPAEMPTRASMRETTKMSKEQLHQQMLEREIKRKKQVEMMEKKAKKLEAMKKPPLTQAQRLAEAASVEKRNAKSLNRWEEAEKQREEERLRKIAALQNRKLDGPVVTFWSGIQELEDGQMKHVGNLVSMEEKAPRKKRQSLAASASAAQGAEGAKTDTDSKPASPIDGGTADGGDKAQGKPEGQPDSQSLPSAPIQGTKTLSTAQGTPLAVPPSVMAPPPQQQQQSSMAPPPAPETPRFASPPSASPVSAPPVPQAQPPPSFQPLQTPSNQPGPSLTPPPPQQSHLQLPRGPMAPPPIPPPPDMKSGGSGFLAAPSMLGHPYGGTTPPRLGSQMPMMGMAAPGMQQQNVLAAPNSARTGPHGPSPLSMPPRPSPPAHGSTPRTDTLGTPGVPAVSITATNPSPAIPVPSLKVQQPPSNAFQPVQSKAPPKSPDTPRGSTPALEAKVTKSCIILSNFDENAIKDKQVQTQILFGRKMNKLAKAAHPPLCVITNNPARYRDPRTGLPYANSYAFKEIQRLHRGDYKWSRLIGAWVGSGTFAAKGVPERFLNPNAKVEEDEGRVADKGPAVDGEKPVVEEVKKVEESAGPSIIDLTAG